MDSGRRYGPWLTNAFIIGVLILATPATFSATVYQCEDATGAMVYTDSPVQASRCDALDLDAPASSEQPAQAVAQIATKAAEVPASYFGEVTRSTDVTVRMQQVRQTLTVSTRINGTRDARLIVDTGSSHTILSREIAQGLGLLSRLQARPATLTTGGGPVIVQLARVDSIRIGGAEVRENLVVVYDLPDLPPGVDGILGLSFLSQFQVILDMPSGEFRLRQPGNAAPTYSF